MAEVPVRRSEDLSLCSDEMAERLGERANAARSALALTPDGPGEARELTQAVREQIRLLGASSALEGSPFLAEIGEAAGELRAGDMQAAEVRLRTHLRSFPRDTAAMRLMALIALRSGFAGDADRILRRAQEYEPDSIDTALAIAAVLRRQSRLVDALHEIDSAFPESDHVGLRLLRGSLLLLLGRADDAEAVFEKLVRDFPLEKAAWVNLGYLSASVGKFGRAVAAYRTSIAIDPALGASWLGLANLKRARLHDEDVETMSIALEREDMSDEARAQIGFALATALDQKNRTEEAFAAYASANRLHRNCFNYNDEAFEAQAARLRDRLNERFFDERRDWGCDRPGPIFIVGMTRSGSTLLEQILASHSSIEGADELKIVHSMATRLAAGHETATLAGALNSLSADGATALGDDYLQKAAQWRRTGRSYFTDKMPSNWVYAGLIHLILPNARIIDIRRHPLACGWSNFTQYIQHGMAHTCDLAEFGSYYRRYVRTMAHYDQVLPGRIHRIHYENLVADPEKQVRRLFQYLDLPFEHTCLEFHRTGRAIFTPSSQQVRQPMNSAGIDRWRAYDDRLLPLKEALGDVLTLYPEVPTFLA